MSGSFSFFLKYIQASCLIFQCLSFFSWEDIKYIFFYLHSLYWKMWRLQREFTVWVMDTIRNIRIATVLSLRTKITNSFAIC